MCFLPISSFPRFPFPISHFLVLTFRATRTKCGASAVPLRTLRRSALLGHHKVHPTPYGDITICNVYCLRIARADRRWNWIQTCPIVLHREVWLARLSWLCYMSGLLWLSRVTLKVGTGNGKWEMGNEEMGKWNGNAQVASQFSLARSQTLAGLRETTSQCRRGQWSVHVVQGS